jgi:hypothetical protein
LLSYNFSIGYDISLAGTRPAEFRLQFRFLPTGMIGRSLVRVQIVERNRQAKQTSNAKMVATIDRNPEMNELMASPTNGSSITTPGYYQSGIRAQ